LPYQLPIVAYCNWFLFPSPGSAGVGKTLVLSHIIDALRAEGRTVNFTALTGIAAINLDKGGSTIHSFSGWYQPPPLNRGLLRVVE
jgi:hypothetical protein